MFPTHMYIYIYIYIYIKTNIVLLNISATQLHTTPFVVIFILFCQDMLILLKLFQYFIIFL